MDKEFKLYLKMWLCCPLPVNFQTTWTEDKELKMLIESSNIEELPPNIKKNAEGDRI